MAIKALSRLSMRSACHQCLRSHSTATASSRQQVRIVEVSPRDGLQNEPKSIESAVKADLIHRLANHGFSNIEAGSFVTPKVKQMANTASVMKDPLTTEAAQKAEMSILIPNMRGFDQLQQTMQELGAQRSVKEVALFVSATEAFSKANLNATVAETLDKSADVAQRALAGGYRVRGYVSCVVACPFEGKVDPVRVAEISERLVKMGCYEVSICDTIGVAVPSEMEAVLNATVGRVPIENVAIHCHDTYGTAVANVLHTASLGANVFDASIAGLGGCPFAPGASGNVATEDVVYALEREGFDTGLVPKGADSLTSFAKAVADMAMTGQWICEQIDKPYTSRAGTAALSKIRHAKA